MARWIHSYHFASERRGVTGRCARLQYLHSISSIENNAQNSSESFGENAYLTTWCDLIDLGRAGNNGECIKVSYIEVAAIGDCRRHDLALAGRNVNDTGYVTVRRDPIQLAVVWSKGVEITADGYHAVPGFIGFKIVRLGIGDRKSHHERAQVSNQFRGAVCINTEHAIWHLRHLRHTM